METFLAIEISTQTLFNGQIRLYKHFFDVFLSKVKKTSSLQVEVSLKRIETILKGLQTYKSKADCWSGDSCWRWCIIVSDMAVGFK